MRSTIAITCRSHRQYFPENNPESHPAGHDLRRRERAAEHAEHQHRPGPGVPVAGDERHPQLLGEPDARARQAQPQDRLLLRAQPAGRVRSRAMPARTTSTPTRPIRSTPTSDGRTRCSGTSTAYTENNNNTRSMPRVQPARVLRPGQLAGEPKVHARSWRPLLAHRRHE